VVAVLMGVLVLHNTSAPPPAAAPEDPLLPGAPRLVAATPAPPATVPPLGYDVSHPQCRRVLPTTGGFAIIGLNGGRPFTGNRCAARQLSWARGKAAHAVYVNTDNPGSVDPVAYGRKIGHDALARGRRAGVAPQAVWWLDVETANRWRGTVQENATVLDALAVTLQQAGVRVGIYSAPLLWERIAGNWAPALPVWYATGPGTQREALLACDLVLAGSRPSMVQWVQAAAHGRLDHDYVCPAAASRAGELMAVR
jgi:hypothetical protein